MTDTCPTFPTLLAWIEKLGLMNAVQDVGEVGM